MSEIELQKLRSDVEVLKKRLDRLKASNEQDYYDVLDPPVTTTTQELVTSVRVNADELQFEKKTRTIVGKFTGNESNWESWHLGTTCTNGGTTEAISGENVSASAPTIALLRLTGAI
jgi:hypothetical protein